MKTTAMIVATALSTSPIILPVGNEHHVDPVITKEVILYEQDFSNSDNSITFSFFNRQLASYTDENDMWIGDIFDEFLSDVSPDELEKLPNDLSSSINQRLYKHNT